jgi:hypothetical protein
MKFATFRKILLLKVTVHLLAMQLRTHLMLLHGWHTLALKQALWPLTFVLYSITILCIVGYDVFTAAVTNVAVYWDVASCSR